MELGMFLQPFSVNYDKYKGLITHSWLKTIREKCHAYRVLVELGVTIEPPRVGNKWLMQVFTEAGYVDLELEALNRVRLYLQVLFLSDVLEAGGRYLDQDYIQLGWGEKRSNYDFQRECLSVKDEMLWMQALQHIAPCGRVATPLRTFVNKGHKLWRWNLHETQQILTFQPEYGSTKYIPPLEAPG